VSYHWNWRIFWEPSPEGAGTYWTMLLQGLVTTLEVSVLAWAVALVLGSLMGVLRTVPNRAAQAIGAAWVELFRNIPLLVQLFLWYFVLPEVVPTAFGDWLKSLQDAPFLIAAAGIGFFMSARVAEQLRAGLGALPQGQRYAGTALGLTLPQTYRYVLLPMAFRIILPPLTSELINTVKNTSVALTIGLAELTARARAMQEFSFQVFEAFTAATAGYLVVNLAATLLMRWLERRVRVPGYVGG
jgi:glutamate/aspartate transport system permease protein